MAIIGITMGCPAGVGPEIILRYFDKQVWPDTVQPVIIGDSNILEKCGRDLGLPANCVPWTPGDLVPKKGIPILNRSSLPTRNHVWGTFTRETAECMADYIIHAIELAKKGLIDAITTCPISKSGLQLAGYTYPGHTEMLVDLTGAGQYTMMMAGSSLRVTLATIHCSLASVPGRLSVSSIYELIQITYNALQIDFGIEQPTIAVAGLNPHSSEDGLFGNEENQVIIPAIERARQDKISVAGPFPPDTVFFKAASGQFDAVVCMYHDQGLIPFKLLHFKDGVNVTLGLPVVRTSVDHGTAYDIAGKGYADESSLAAAVTMAAEISDNRKNYLTS